MAETNRPAGDRTARLTIRATLLEAKGAENVPKVAAYAFTAGGRLLHHAALPEGGAAQLSFPAAGEAMNVRVMIGPEPQGKEIRLGDLRRRGAQEQHVRVDGSHLAHDISFQVIPNRWRCWLLGFCYVTGTLLKREVVGGVAVDMPVCNATVQIYQVEPFRWILQRLPDEVIARLREMVVDPLRFRPPLPDPPPFSLEAPDHLFGPVFPPLPPPPTATLLGSEALVTVPEDLLFAAQNAGVQQFRAKLIENVDLIRELFCWFFPPWVTTELVGTAQTDECGHFQTWAFLGCDDDPPNLYFTASQLFLGFIPITIYDPLPVPCYTWWDYSCGSEVTLYTTSPFATTCPPCPPVIAPENWVLVMAIGNFPLSRIYGTAQSLQGTTTADNLGLTDGLGPWGGLLRPRIEFDNALRDTLGVKYYQVSYRQGSSGSFTPLTGDVVRHYAHMVGTQLVIDPYPLGPQTVNGVPNLFEIPPGMPPAGQWSIPDAVQDTTSALFPTTTYAPPAQAGNYQLKVDLFDASGAPVNIGALGIKFVVPTSTDLTGTIDTVDAATLGLVSGNSFIMTLHVDNNPCNDAVIDAPSLNGNTANDNCGVLNYDPNAPGSVLFGWTASHPNGIGGNGFATYSFVLYRGVNALYIPPPPPANNPTLPASGFAKIGAASFSNTQLVTDLLGGCQVAGFSENLYVAAMAIDGWRRLSEYDRQAVRAFVLSPPFPKVGP